MKNKIVIEPCEGGFKGFLYDGEILVYETSIYSDPSLASKDLMRKMQGDGSTNTQTNVREERNTPSTHIISPPPLKAVETTNPQPQRLKKSCCGRS